MQGSFQGPGRVALRGDHDMGGALFWGPYNKDPTSKGTILGSPIFGNSHIVVMFINGETAVTQGLVLQFATRGRSHNSQQ